MTVDQSSRLDRLEALAETTLLAIRELSNQQQTTQQQLDQAQQRFEARVETTMLAIRELSNCQQTTQQQLDQVQQKLDQVAEQQAANAQQIAENTAGMVEFRNLVTDLVHRRS